MVKNNIYFIDHYLKKLGLQDNEQAAQFFAWILCWHDIGKFAHSFQQLYRHEDLNIFNEPPGHYEKIPHTTLGYWLWNTWLSECPELFPPSSLSVRKSKRVMTLWMPVTTGHHGRPPDAIPEVDHFRQQDKDAAREFLLKIKALFPLITLPEAWDEDEGIAQFQQLSWFISATVVLADWTGSASHYFRGWRKKCRSRCTGNRRSLKRGRPLRFFPLRRMYLPLRYRNAFSFYSASHAATTKSANAGYSRGWCPALYSGKMSPGRKNRGGAYPGPSADGRQVKRKGSILGCRQWRQPTRCLNAWQIAGWRCISRILVPAWCWPHSARHLMDRFNQSIWSASLSGTEEPDDASPIARAVPPGLPTAIKKRCWRRLAWALWIRR
ncbi:CRISPR-associated helicase Cas3 protein [Salmonella bongori]|nr:CRISPR-associated helicase Cas3 protein [Salmonella bongori]